MTRQLMRLISITVLLSISIINGWQWPTLKNIQKLFSPTITDKLGLTRIKVHHIVSPKTIEELQQIVISSKCPISIAGARYSQGGQISYPDGIAIDMTNLNEIINLDTKNKLLTVQAGTTWYDIQKYIDTKNLSVQIMQSYNNFTVGGSLSVNAHSRNISRGPIINTVESLQILLSDGSLIIADKDNHADIFNAAIGGYGLIGIITQATLKLTENIPLERKIQICSVDNFNTTFFNTVASDQSAVFHNTDLFPNRLTDCLITTWHTTQKSLTEHTRLQKQQSVFYLFDKTLEFFLRRIPTTKNIRPLFEQLKKEKPRIVWQNYEMSYSTNQLAIQSLHFPTTMTLQEYFIPIHQASTFVNQLRSILQNNNTNVLNVSIRYVPADTSCLLSYSPQDSFSFVLYLNTLNTKIGIDNTCKWSQDLIDAALENNGSYFLPYLTCATKEQFYKAYPQIEKFLEIKKRYDPHNKFKNCLWKKYIEN